MTESYPLQWPVGYPRTNYPSRHPHFKKTKTFGYERDELLRQLKLLGARDVIISSNVPLRQDGIPYANFERRSITDRGIAVYFTFNKEQKVLACDAWDSFEVNLRALWKTVEDMRALERNGCSQIISQVFTGFKAIPEQTSAKQWWEVLGVSRTASKQDVVFAYRNLAKIHHPDLGGNSSMFSDISEAYQQGLKQAN